MEEAQIGESKLKVIKCKSKARMMCTAKNNMKNAEFQH